MDTYSLLAFLSVAETGSFSKAADALHRSQPAISKRIKALEQELGAQVFDRVNRSIALTDSGRALLPHARRVMQDLEDGRRALSQLSGKVGGRLSIGTSHHIGLHRLPPVLKRYTRKYPEVDLDLHFMDSEVACEAVLAGRLELGIVTLPGQPLPNLHTQRVWPDPLAVVVSPAHPLARKKRLTLKELAGHPAVLPDEATYTHRIITAELRKHGIEPRVRLATNYLETLKMLVGINLGWSVLPRSMLDRSIVPLVIAGFQARRELGVVWHERRTLSGAARALVSTLPTSPENGQ